MRPHRARAPRRLAAGAALAVLTLGSVTACSGGGGAGDNKDADADGDGSSTPAEVLAYAKTLLDETSGVTLSLSTDDDADTDAFLKSASGTVTADPPAFEGKASGRFAGQDASDIGVNSVDGTFQVELPFIGYSTFDPTTLCAPDPALLLDPDTGVSSVLTAAEDLSDGEETRGGADNGVLTAYEGTVPGAAVTNILPCAPGETFEATFTVDADGYLRGAEVTGEFFPDGGSITYTIDIEEYDVDTTISAP